jgi:hypothetical protein
MSLLKPVYLTRVHREKLEVLQRSLLTHTQRECRNAFISDNGGGPEIIPF